MNQYLAPPQPKLCLRRYPPLTNFFRTTSYTYRDKPKLQRDLEGCCEVGVLIDLSEPALLSPPVAGEENKKCSSPIVSKCSSPIPAVVSKSPVRHQRRSGSEDGELKENSNPLFDSIEIERSDNCKTDGLVCPGTPQNLWNKALRDITNDAEGWNFLKLSSPVTKLIEDESFDFDFTLSPCSMRSKNLSNNEDRLAELDDEEDEVFIGPVGFTEKCVAVNVQEEADKVKPLSPLSADKFAQIRKEALMVAIRIGQNADVDSERDENQAPKSCKELKFPSGSNECFSPSKQKHVRGQTFTVSKMLSEVLPENVNVPVINCDDDIRTVMSENESLRAKASCDKSSKEDKESNRSRLAVPKSKPLVSKLPRDRSKTKLPVFGSTERINGEISSGIDTDDACSVASDVSDTSTVPNSKLPMKKSGIAQPLRMKNSGIKKPSKLQPPSANLTNRSFNSSNESLNSASVPERKLQPPKAYTAKSTPGDKAGFTKANSGKKGSSQLQTGIHGTKGPLAKKSLMEPSALQKPKWGVGKGKGNASSLPMKATVAAKKETDKKEIPAKTCSIKPEVTNAVMKEDIPTPVKPEKRVEPKLLSQKFSTPARSSSTSSCTPMSSRRRSCLPTPQRTRPTSLSSLPPQSPLGLNDSTRKSSLRKSSHNSVSQSPIPSQQKPAVTSARRSISGSNQSVVNGSSTPSALKTSANQYQQVKIPKSTEHSKPAQKASVKMVTSSEVKAKMLGRRSYHVYQTIHE